MYGFFILLAAAQTPGAMIGNGATNVAQDLSLGVTGICLLMTVIYGIIILANVGGSGLQKHVKSWVLQLALGTLLGAGFTVVVTGFRSLLGFG